ncbi:MAG: ClbS/DfsB family four-helix bundle protein [Burkholderiaceae bacterium]
MAAAANKSDLIAVTEKEYEKLAKLLESVSARQAGKKEEDDTSIKDVVAHRAHWITLFLGWYKDGLAGKEVFFPAKGYKWSELKAYNRQLRLDQRAMSWPDAASLLKTNHKKLLKFMRDCSEADLYGHPMKGANNQWTAGRWAEAAGPSHYRSAAKFVRACLKASG